MTFSACGSSPSLVPLVGASAFKCAFGEKRRREARSVVVLGFVRVLIMARPLRAMPPSSLAPCMWTSNTGEVGRAPNSFPDVNRSRQPEKQGARFRRYGQPESSTNWTQWIDLAPQTIASVREGPGGDSSHKRGRMPSQTPHGLHSTRLSHLPSKTDAPVFSRRLRPENELATKYERSSLGLPENAGKCIIHPPTGF